jgi:hypothetical protein
MPLESPVPRGQAVRAPVVFRLGQVRATPLRPGIALLIPFRAVARRGEGVPVGRGVDLYLSAARRAWAELPAVIRGATEGGPSGGRDGVAGSGRRGGVARGRPCQAGRELFRREETVRRELVDDLLRGDAHLSELVERAEPFRLDLTRTHQVALETL